MVLINLPLGAPLPGPRSRHSLPCLLCSLEEGWARESPFFAETGRGRQQNGTEDKASLALVPPRRLSLLWTVSERLPRSPYFCLTKAQCTGDRGQPQRAVVLEGDCGLAGQARPQGPGILPSPAGTPQVEDLPFLPAGGGGTSCLSPLPWP